MRPSIAQRRGNKVEHAFAGIAFSCTIMHSCIHTIIRNQYKPYMRMTNNRRRALLTSECWIVGQRTRSSIYFLSCIDRYVI